MPLKFFISIKLFAIGGSLLVAVFQRVTAQVTVTKQIFAEDSLIVIKQLLRNKLMHEAEQAMPFAKTGGTSLKRLVSDSLAMDSLGNMLFQEMRQVPRQVVLTGNAVLKD